ncbi:MAG: hypothetical protein J7M26_09800 [Armatimonadetes bacterium]|nr:hypothetical protein [Armatimonadota bacterium]
MTRASLLVALAGLVGFLVAPKVPASCAGGDEHLFSFDASRLDFHVTLERRTDQATVWLVTYTSPVPLGPPENRTVYAHYWQPLHPQYHPCPAVIALHVSGSNKAKFPKAVMHELAKRGIAGAWLELPFHMHRRPPGADAATGFTRPDTTALLEVMRESAMDVRALVEWLLRRPEIDPSRLGLAGFSLGACVGALVYSIEPRLHGAVLVGGGGHPASLVWHSGLLVSARYALQHQGVTEETLATILTPVDACHYATPERGRDVLMINALHDWVVSVACTHALWESFGRCRIMWQNSGHFTLFAHPDHLARTIADWMLYRWALADSFSPSVGRGELLKLGFVHSHELGTRGAVFLEVYPLDRGGRAAAEVALTLNGHGLVGASARVFDNLSVGLGVPIGTGKATIEPYVSGYVSF